MPRNASGTYSLPSGNPVVAGTTIEAAWANNTLSDVGNELTNSLSRQGTGGMLAALRLADGSVTVPGLAFVSETTTGFYRAASNDMRMAILGSDVWAATSSAFTISKAVTLSVASNLGTPSALTLTNATGLPLTTGVTGTLPVANGGTGITAFGTGVATALGQNVTGSGGIVLATSPTLTTPNLGTPSAVTLTNATGLPVATGISGLGTGVAAALAVNTGSAGAFVVNGGALGTPSSGTVTNLTGTASININGTVGATTPNTGSFTTLTTSSTVTLSAGTANGVLYLNGSKVATSGSALTFDGTNLGIGTTNPAAFGLLAVNGASASVNINATTGAAAFKLFEGSGTGRGSITSLNGSDGLAFLQGVTEAMRLNSTGLGIGTNNPSRRLEVASPTAALVRITSSAGGQTGYAATEFYNAAGFGYVGTESSVAGTLFVGTTAYATILGNTAAYPIQFATNNTVRATLDSSGNLGIGTTAPLTGSSRKALTLNSAAGQLSIVEFGINGTIGGYVYANSSQLTVSANGASNTSPITFEAGAQERARITSGGDFGIGATPTSYGGTFTTLAVNNSGAGVLDLMSGGVSQFRLFGNASENRLQGVTNVPMTFYTNNTERARITSTGNVVAGGSVALATNATDGFLYVPTCAGTPTGTPTAITGMAPIVVNTTNNKLYFYSGGQWRDAGP